MEYTLIRSGRKTLGLQVKNGEVIVRAPVRARAKDIEAFVLNNRDWIEKHLALERSRAEAASAAEPLTGEELAELANRAKRVIPERASHFARLLGVEFGRISIRKQRTKWGSCSSRGNLNFNCLLMLAPPEVMDYVVVHELCHIKQMNHSKAFYAEVKKLCPDYKKHQAWLKENGPALLAGLEKGRG